MNNKRCPISYDLLAAGETYSAKGLARLSRNLKELSPLPFSAQGLLLEAAKKATKMSIQGMQPKLSAKLNSKAGCFDIVENKGRYILKPPLLQYSEVPENEDITMRLAKIIGIEIPMHGLVLNEDNTYTYFIKRFDRASQKSKYLVEDFAQLSNRTRDVKYRSSMEEVVKVIDNFCTFPMLEKQKLLRLTLFSFLIGNEDMHLKNFSLITIGGKTQLSPAYDLLNTTIMLSSVKDELALPLNGKKKNLRKKDFIDYLAIERMGLNVNTSNEVLDDIQNNIPMWKELISQCFLSAKMKDRYLQLLDQRIKRLDLCIANY